MQVIVAKLAQLTGNPQPVQPKRRVPARRLARRASRKNHPEGGEQSVVR